MVRLVVGLLFWVGFAGLLGCRSREECWREERERSLRIADAMQTERRARELASVGKVLATIACECDRPVTVWVVDPMGGRRQLLVVQPGARRQTELTYDELDRLVCRTDGDRPVAYRRVQLYAGDYRIILDD